MYPGMKKLPSKSILKKSSSIELNRPEFFISDQSLKDDEMNGRLNRKDLGSRISFKEDIKVTYIASFKHYNETGEYPSDDGNCSCIIF